MKILGAELPTVEPTVRYRGILNDLQVEQLKPLREAFESYDDKSPELGDILQILGSAISRLLISDPYDFEIKYAGSKFIVEFLAGSNIDPHGHGYQKMGIKVALVSRNNEFEVRSLILTYDDKTGVTDIEEYTNYARRKDIIYDLLDVCCGNWDYTEECRDIEQQQLTACFIRSRIEQFFKDPSVIAIGALLGAAFIGGKFIGRK